MKYNSLVFLALLLSVVSLAQGLPVAGIMTGPSVICLGTTATMTDTSSGGAGVWSSSNSFLATVGSTGIVTAVSPGVDTIEYTVTNIYGTATALKWVTVSPVVMPAISISASPGVPTYSGVIFTGFSVCAGASVTFTAHPVNGGDTPTYGWTLGGAWISGATDSTYTYVPASGDIVGITMGSSYPCRTADSVFTSVTMAIDVPVITATAIAVGCGGPVTLIAGGGTSYSWSPSAGLSCGACATATVLPAATTTYTVTGTDAAGCTGTGTAVADGNLISGHIAYGGAASAGIFKVWLIRFNSSDSSITAVDSTFNCVDAGAPYYEFMDKPAGNYMAKAELVSAIPGTSDYIPTYSLSTPYWDAATTINHAGNADTLHVNMIYGTVPAGPGFISGYVVSGAGRGMTGDVPVAGMLIYLEDASGSIITYTYTGADGTYSFSGIAEGGYIVYPEAYKYYTTPSSLLTLAAGADSATGVNFKQHTSYGTITPFADNTKVSQPLYPVNEISVYPNPTTGSLIIQWNNRTTGTADVTITDVAEREVLMKGMNMNTVQGQTQVDVGGLDDGFYIITIRSDKVYYTAKLVKQH